MPLALMIERSAWEGPEYILTGASYDLVKAFDALPLGIAGTPEQGQPVSSADGVLWRVMRRLGMTRVENVRNVTLTQGMLLDTCGLWGASDGFKSIVAPALLPPPAKM